MIRRLPPPPLPPDVIAANLAAAQRALAELTSGARVAHVSYAEGSGNREVTYARAQIGDLTRYIEDLQTRQGYRARRPIGMRFG